MSSPKRRSSNSVVNKPKKTFNRKLYYSALSALLFIAVSLPYTYSLTSQATEATTGVSTTSGICPTTSGVFLHTFVFFALSYLMMWWQNGNKRLTNGLMLKYSFYSALIYFLLSSTDAYKLTGNFAEYIVEESHFMGCPTTQGVIVHGLVFLVVILLVMYFPADRCDCPFVAKY